MMKKILPAFAAIFVLSLLSSPLHADFIDDFGQVGSWYSYNSPLNLIDGVLEVMPVDDPSSYSGAYTKFNSYAEGNYSPTSIGYGFTVMFDANLDSSLFDSNTGFDISCALNGSDNTHDRDNIFHVGYYDDGTGNDAFQVNFSHNTGFQLNTNDIENGFGDKAVLDDGWYTFVYTILPTDSPDAVDVTAAVYQDDTEYFSWSNEVSLNGTHLAGGARYLWVNYTTASKLQLANVTLIPETDPVGVPEPSTIALLLGGLASIVCFRRRK